MKSRDQHAEDITAGLNNAAALVKAFVNMETDFVDESGCLQRYDESTSKWTAWNASDIINEVWADPSFTIHGKLLDALGTPLLYKQIHNLCASLLKQKQVRRSVGYVADSSGRLFNSHCIEVQPSQAIFLKRSLPVEIDVDAESPLLDKFLDRFGLEPDVIDAALALCWFAELGRPTYNLEKYVLISGVGGSGKSTFVNLLAHCFTNAQGRFLDVARGRNGSRREDLIHNGLFISTEEPLIAYRRSDVDGLKAISAAEVIDIERKGKDVYQARSLSLPVLVTNEVGDWAPRLREKAVYRRTLHLNFNTPLDPSHADPNLMSKLIQDGAREAIVARAFKAFQRLAINGGDFSSTFKFKQDELDSIQTENSHFQEAVDTFEISAEVTPESVYVKNTVLSKWLKQEFSFIGHPRTLVSQIAVATDSAGRRFQTKKRNNAACTLLSGWHSDLQILADAPEATWSADSGLGDDLSTNVGESSDLFQTERTYLLETANNGDKK